MADEYFNHFDEIANKLETALSQIVKTAAFNIQGGYQRDAKRDTSFMANSAYVVTSGESTYSAAKAAAESANAQAVMLPEIEHPTSKTEAAAAIGAEYADYVENGTVHMPGDFTLAKTVEAEKQPFLNALGKLGDALK